jgi:single-strand DNA-binding protein
MANSYNKIILVGNLGRDAELRATPQGKQVLTSSLAVEDPSKKDDRGRPGTEWFRIKVWGRQAETLSPHLLKGKSILVEGRLSIQTWTDREGHNRFTPEVSADRVVLLGSPGAHAGGPARETPAPVDINADDIPF